jgi:class 3 adenylate cyclase
MAIDCDAVACHHSKTLDVAALSCELGPDYRVADFVERSRHNKCGAKWPQFWVGRVRRHGGAIVKTVGDAMMGALHDPAGAIQAALAIQDEVAGFNRWHPGSGFVLKLGLHQGACIAVTAGACSPISARR